QPGRYDVWAGGSFSQRFVVWVDRHRLGSVPLNIGPPGQYVRVGQVHLTRGDVPILIVRPRNSLTPGENATTQSIGPVVLVRSGAAPSVQEIAPGQAQSLCGRELDWVEVVRQAPR